MELHSYVATLKPYWKAIIIAPIVAGLLALAATYVFTKYSATTTFVVLPQEADPRTFSLAGEDDQTTAPLDSRNTAQVVTRDTIEQIVGRPNAVMVVEELGLDQKQPITNPIQWFKSVGRKTKNVVLDFVRYGTYRQKPRFEAAVDAVHGSLTGKQVEDTYVVKITAIASTSTVARDIANTSVQTYIQSAQDQRALRLKERREHLEVGLYIAAVQAKDVRQQLTALREQTILPSPAQISGEISSVAEIEQSLVETEAALSSARTRLASVESQLLQTPRTISATTRSDSPDVPNTQIVTPNLVYQQLESTRLSIQREISSLQVRQNELRNALEKRGPGGESLVTRDSLIEALELELALASSLQATRQAETDTARMVEQRSAQQLRIIEEADAPLYPVGPMKYLWTGAAVALALALTVMLAFVLDYYNLNIRSPQQAADIFGAPALAVVGTGRGANLSVGVYLPNRHAEEMDENGPY